MPPHGPPSAAHRVQTTCSIILAFLLLVLGSGGYGRPDNKHPNHLKAQVHTGRHGRWARDSPDSEAPEKPVPPVALSDLPAPGAGNISWAYRHVSWTVEEFPNPWTEPARCGARQPSFICDPNRMLSPQEGGCDVMVYISCLSGSYSHTDEGVDALYRLPTVHSPYSDGIHRYVGDIICMLNRHAGTPPTPSV